MILTTLIATALVAPAAMDDKPLSCPIMGSPAAAGGSATDYNGVRYRYCCGGCQATFEKSPEQALKSPKIKDLTLGISLFDPVAQHSITAKTAKGGFSDHSGVRYYFLRPDNKATFDADPKKYGTPPAKEAMYCPVLKIELKNYFGCNGYVDYEGVRYYVCCDSCLGALKANPAGFVGNSSAYVKSPKALNVSAELAKVTGF